MDTRHHLITGEPMIHAPERASRPSSARDSATPSTPDAHYDAACPFCPGNESQTPAESSRIGNPWSVRAFPNKYPFALFHEVIVESPDHAARTLDVARMEEVVAMWVATMQRAAATPGVRHATLFRNEGARAGASLVHRHSQVAGTDFIPPRIGRETGAFLRASGCPLCSASDRRFVAEEEHFVCFSPSARAFAGEVWIAPRHHVNSFASIADEAIADLASVLAAAEQHVTAASASHNCLLIDFPDERRGHYYFQCLPRKSVVAGFELATGTWIDDGREKAG